MTKFRLDLRVQGSDWNSQLKLGNQSFYGAALRLACDAACLPSDVCIHSKALCRSSGKPVLNVSQGCRLLTHVHARMHDWPLHTAMMHQ